MHALQVNEVFVTRKNLLEFKVKCKGPKQEPCGTPIKGSSKLSDCSPFTMTCCEWPDKYDLSHCSAVPVIPRTCQVDESTVSKAELKSKRSDNVTCCRFMLCKISSTTLKSAVSVLCSLLYADWNTGYKIWSSKCLCSCSNISYKDLKRKARSMDIFRELTFKETSTATTNFRREDFNYI